MAKSEPVLFHEEQALGRWHGKLVLAIPPAALIFVALRQLVWRHPWGNPPVTNAGLLFLTILLALVYVRLITVRLVTGVRPAEVVVGLHGLWHGWRFSPRHRQRAVFGGGSATHIRQDHEFCEFRVSQGRA